MLMRALVCFLCFLPLGHVWGQVKIAPAPAELPLPSMITSSQNIPSSRPTKVSEVDKDKKPLSKTSSYKRHLPWALGITGGILGSLILYRAYPSSSQQPSLPAQTEPKFNLDTAYIILQKPTGNISADEWGLLESNANLLHTSSRDLALKVGLLKKNEQVFSLVYDNPQDSRFLQLITISKYLNYRRHKSLENKPSLPPSFRYTTGLNVDGKFDLKRSHVSLIKELFINAAEPKSIKLHFALAEAQKLLESLTSSHQRIVTDLKYLRPDFAWEQDTIYPKDVVQYKDECHFTYAPVTFIVKKDGLCIYEQKQEGDKDTQWEKLITESPHALLFLSRGDLLLNPATVFEDPSHQQLLKDAQEIFKDKRNPFESYAALKSPSPA